MIKPDMILMWPDHLDFPGFRLFYKENHKYFNKLIVSFTTTNSNTGYEKDIVPFLQEQLTTFHKVDFISKQETDRYNSPSWVNRAICPCFNKVESDYILIYQQDFDVYNPKFFDIVFNTDYELISRKEGLDKECIYGCQMNAPEKDVRHEPDFILIKTEHMLNSSMDFTEGKNPNTQIPMDVFGPWSIEIDNKVKNKTTLHKLDLHFSKDYYHMRGFVQSLCFSINNNFENIYNKKIFIQHHRNIMDNLDKISLHPITFKLTKKIAGLNI